MVISKLEVHRPQIRKTHVKRTMVEQVGGLDAYPVRTERYDEHFEPAQGLDFFDVYRTPEGDPVHPDAALDAVLAGAEIVTDFDAASAVVHWFTTEARTLPVTEKVAYQRVLDAFMYVICRKREELAWEMLGHDVLGVSGGSAFFTEKQVAELYGVSAEEVRTMAGQRLPAAITHPDGSHYFNAAAIVTQLRNAGPASPPKPFPVPKPKPTLKKSK